MRKLKNRKVAFLLLSLFYLITGPALSAAENIFIFAPYAGPETSRFENSEYGLSSKDTGFLTGGYVQMINPDRFQWNTFFYYSPDVNDSKLTGVHFIFDWYFLNSQLGHFTVGTGMEYIHLNMDAGDAYEPLEDFTMINNIFVNFYRAGYHFRFNGDNTTFSIFPWAGIQYNLTRGSLNFAMLMGPPQPTEISSDIDETEVYGVAGINLKLNLFHFIDLEAKYRGTFNGERYLHTFSAMANIFFTKFMGVSYRFRYMENTSGFEMYHIFGLAFVLR